MKKEEVYLDLTKLSKEQLIKVAEVVKDEMYIFRYNELSRGVIDDYIYLLKDHNGKFDFSKTIGRKKAISYNQFINLFQEKEEVKISTSGVITQKHNEKTKIKLNTLLEIEVGDVFELNGYICEVKEKVDDRKWYRVDSDLDAYYIKLNEDEVLWRRAEEISVKEITDYHFINLLEKNSK